MKTIYFIVMVFIFSDVCLLSCKEKNSNNIKYNPNGTIKELIILNKDTIGQKVEYSFYENGQIKEIRRYNEKLEYSGEQLWFYPDGILDRKIPFKEGNANGNGYFFYDTTGTLNGHRYFRNDKQVFHGSDYWEDSIGIIQSILYMNDSGHIYYKKNFDKMGNVISEEGKKE